MDPECPMCGPTPEEQLAEVEFPEVVEELGFDPLGG